MSRQVISHLTGYTYTAPPKQFLWLCQKGKHIIGCHHGLIAFILSEPP